MVAGTQNRDHVFERARLCRSVVHPRITTRAPLWSVDRKKACPLGVDGKPGRETSKAAVMPARRKCVGIHHDFGACGAFKFRFKFPSQVVQFLKRLGKQADKGLLIRSRDWRCSCNIPSQGPDESIGSSKEKVRRDQLDVEGSSPQKVQHGRRAVPHAVGQDTPPGEFADRRAERMERGTDNHSYKEFDGEEVGED